VGTRLYDSHNHLQDAALTSHAAGILAELDRQGLARAVVNGTCEEDWPAVSALARRSNKLVPSYGLHPWFVNQASQNWQTELTRYLGEGPVGIGEIGLDRWIEGYDLPKQEEVFLWQWRLATQRNLPVSIHCLRAWGRLLELLEREPGPGCGFLLHSFGGPQEMIGPLAKLGAYFSISGYFAHERKARQRETFRHVPPDRLLIETDAPDMLPPPEYIEYPLADEAAGKPVNNPANIGAVYRFVAGMLGESIDALAARVSENFNRLFGGLSTGTPESPERKAAGSGQ
jgi:TatD DNase family protein